VISSKLTSIDKPLRGKGICKAVDMRSLGFSDRTRFYVNEPYDDGINLHDIKADLTSLGILV